MKPILMNPADTLSQMASSQTNGLGRLNAISCKVSEERNGLYEAELSVFIDDEHFSLLSVGSVLKIMTNEGMQLFRVYQITKPMNGVCSVYAHHITYDLNKAPVLPFTATGSTNSLNGLVSHLVTSYEFNVFTDIVNPTSTFTLQEPKYFRECLGGYRGSILDVFGGEYEWDNLTVKLLAHRGSDNGVQIRYGKNMTDVEQETNIENMYTAVLGFATVDDVTTTGSLQTIVPGTAPKTLILDFSNEFESGDTVSDVIIDNLAQAYIASHDLSTPKISIDVSFVALAETDQYKEIAPLEHVKLCDTVHVYFEKLGIEASAKVIKTEYDSLNERLTSVEVGDAKSTMTDMIDSNIADAEEEQTQAVNAVDAAVQNLTSMILNSLGLFVTKVQKSGGGYQYYMHNRPVLADSQYQWTINAGGFAVSQDYGATWSAGIDVDGNAVFNSLAANIINAMTITGSTVNGAVIVFDPEGNPVTAQRSALGNGGVKFTGDGDFTISTQTVGITGNGTSGSEQEVQLVGKDTNGTSRCAILLTDSELYLRKKDSSDVIRDTIRMRDDGYSLHRYDSSGVQRASIQMAENSTGVYHYDSSGSIKSSAVLNDNGVTVSGSAVALPSGTTINGVKAVTSGSNSVICSSGTYDGHTVLNFFLNGTYVGHTNY